MKTQNTCGEDYGRAKGVAYNVFVYYIRRDIPMI